MSKLTIDSLLEQLKGYGSGVDIEGERDYKTKGSPLVWHVRMYGLIYPEWYEVVDRSLQKALAQVLADSRKFEKKHIKAISE